MAKPLSQRLMEEAEAMDRRAATFKGCSFRGEWPGTQYQNQARLLRESAALALKSEKIEERRQRKTAKK